MNLVNNNDLIGFVEKEVFPRYENFYSHGVEHVRRVTELAVEMADFYNLNTTLAYIAGALHDSGLAIDRENHEKESGRIVRKEPKLKDFFTPEEIEIIAEAVEDHRGSRKERPRNKYGEIISDADRDFSVETLAKRQLATSLKNYPALKTFDEHFERCYEYISRRIRENGHFNLWTNYPKLIESRDDFEKTFMDKNVTASIYKTEWDRISSDGTMEKIKNFYLDW